MTVKISYLQPYKVRTFTTCLAFPPWCSRYTVHNKVAFKTEVNLNWIQKPDIVWRDATISHITTVQSIHPCVCVLDLNNQTSSSSGAKVLRERVDFLMIFPVVRNWKMKLFLSNSKVPYSEWIDWGRLTCSKEETLDGWSEIVWFHLPNFFFFLHVECGEYEMFFYCSILIIVFSIFLSVPFRSSFFVTNQVRGEDPDSRGLLFGLRPNDWQ